MAPSLRSSITLKLLFVTAYLYAQDTSQTSIVSSGAHVTNSSGQLTWSIGQVIASSNDVNGVLLTEGFHQVDHVVTLPPTLSASDQVIKVYPNPAIDFVMIQSSGAAIGAYTLINIEGKVMDEKSEVDFSRNPEISLQELAAGTYLLTLQIEDQVRRVKIVKQ